MSRRNYTFERAPARRNIERILVLLADQAMTEPELCDRLHMSMASLKLYVQYMREQRMIYISSWTRRAVLNMRSYLRPQYRAGDGNDAWKPGRKAKVDIARDYRRRVKQSPEEYPRGYRKFRAQMARQQARLRTKRMQELAAAGFDPHTLGLVNGRVVIGNTRRTPTPDQLAEIIRLRESGMIWKDIAKATGVPKTTARDHYQRAVG